MAKLADLLAQKAALEKKIDDVRRTERAEVVAQIRALMAQYGLSVADLGGPARAAGSPSRSTAAADAPAAGKPRRSRKGVALGKVPPKYRDPVSGATWSGRGLKPKWLTVALAAGRSLDDFKL